MPAPTRNYTDEELTYPYKPMQVFKAKPPPSDYWSTDKVMMGLLIFLMVVL